MIANYFGNLGDGKLARLRFFGLWALLIFLFIVFGMMIVMSIGIAEHMVGGDLTSAQNFLREKLALPALVGIAIAALLFTFVNLNIMAKRARDIGLPGWLTAIVIAGLSGGASQVAGPSASGSVGGLLFLVLTLLPSNIFKR